MNFEILPNEILIECFNYLNPIDLFYSFDYLNTRLSTLIRRIKLHINFQSINKYEFDRFCLLIDLDFNIKQQTQSICLSNKDFCQIYFFLSKYSLNEFIHLRSLTLINVKEHNISQLQAILPFLSQLLTFRLVESDKRCDRILSALQISQLRILSIPRSSWFDQQSVLDISSIIKLSISDCNINTLHRVLTLASTLTSLSIDYVGRNSNRILSEKAISSSLQKLIIKDFDEQCSELIHLLKRTPYLQSLTLVIDSDHHVFDADQWETFINSSLSFLRTFQFVFEYDHLNKLKQFQTYFWQYQHHWYTEYILFGDMSVVYTLPLILDRYSLTSNMNIFSNQSIDFKNKYDHVRDLTIDPQCEFRDYFSYITNLTLEKLVSTTINQYNIESMTKLFNFTHIKHLQIDLSCQIYTPCILLEIFKRAPNISSLSIDLQQLLPLLDVDEFCYYLKLMIKQLDLISKITILFENVYLMNKFCETFVNIEQITCCILERDSLLFFLNRFPKLLRLNIPSTMPRFIYQILDLEQEKLKLSIEIIFDLHLTSTHGLSMWIIHYGSYFQTIEKIKSYKNDSILNRIQMKMNRMFFKCVV